MRRPLLLLLLLVIPTASLHAEDARIEALSATADRGLVSIRFTLEHAFDSREIEKALRSGLPTGFTYYIELVRRRPRWFDGTVTTSRIDVICTYNSLTREYLLNYRKDRRLVRSETISDLTMLRQRMTAIEEPDFLPLGRYRPSKLVVRVKADVLKGFLLYVVPWDFSTRWAETRVRTAGSP